MTLKPEDPRPSPVGREEVRDRIARLVWFMALEEVDVTSALHPNNDAAWEHWRNESESAPSRACADAILALFSPADGWRLVPTDPDGAMKMAGCAAPRSDATRAATNTLARQMETVADIYRAMLAAAPPPPGGQG